MANKIVLVAIFLLLSITGCVQSKQTDASVAVSSSIKKSSNRVETLVDPGLKPKNIIFLIGDGMGISQLTAGLYSNNNEIAMERMPIVGLHKSYSSDNLVTDSAAGATAFACGIKTYNGAIGVGPDSSDVRSIFEDAKEMGMATGLVATSTIVHATPASFFAHELSRQSYENIAAQLASSDVDFFIGGGQKFFNQREGDGRNLIEEMSAKGRVVESYFDKGIKEINPNPSKPYGYLTANEDPLPVLGGRDYLQEASKQAVNYLNQQATQNGYFLMIEGSQIDWGGHANDSKYIISEVLEFSKVLDDVLDFAINDGETLVVVTADHETGGYAIQQGSKHNEIIGAFTSTHHTADLIPVFAYGPGAENFSGIYENTALHTKFLKLLAPKKN